MKNGLSFGLIFPIRTRKMFQIGQLRHDMSQNQNGISIRVSSQNQAKTFPIESPPSPRIINIPSPRGPPARRTSSVARVTRPASPRGSSATGRATASTGRTRLPSAATGPRRRRRSPANTERDPAAAASARPRPSGATAKMTAPVAKVGVHFRNYLSI